jgi:hypothetical protein
MMRFSPCRPVENDVGRGDQLDLHDARIDRVLAWVQRRHPDTLVAGIHQVTVLELQSADIHVRFADERDDDADVANGNLNHGHLFDLREPRV